MAYQGAGKSIEMACLAGRLISEPRLENPTLVMVTDRQDLDGQLFSVFAGAGDLLGETPKQANTRSELREHLRDRPLAVLSLLPFRSLVLRLMRRSFPYYLTATMLLSLQTKHIELSMDSRPI